MGNAAIYWYPTPRSGLQVLDLGEGLTDLAPSPVYRGTRGRDLDGALHGVTLAWWQEVQVTLENFDSRSVYRGLKNLESHLGRMGLVGVTADTAKAFAAYTSRDVVRGQTRLVLDGTRLYTSGITLSAGDEVVLESELGPEYASVASHSGRVLTLASGTTYAHRGPVLVRWAEFHPFLGRPEEAASIVFSDHGYLFTLDASFVTADSKRKAFGGFQGVQLRPAGKEDTRDPTLWDGGGSPAGGTDLEPPGGGGGQGGGGKVTGPPGGEFWNPRDLGGMFSGRR